MATVTIANDTATVDRGQLTKEALKDIIANAELDTPIVRGDYRTISLWLHFDGVTGFDDELLETVVDELRSDPYYSRMTIRVSEV